MQESPIRSELFHEKGETPPEMDRQKNRPVFASPNEGAESPNPRVFPEGSALAEPMFLTDANRIS
jgi:hypothetical protein